MEWEFQLYDVAWTGIIEFQATRQPPNGQFGCVRIWKMMLNCRNRLVVRNRIGYPKRFGSILGGYFNDRARSKGHRGYG
jgi:hypothetical protein